MRQLGLGLPVDDSIMDQIELLQHLHRQLHLYMNQIIDLMSRIPTEITGPRDYFHPLEDFLKKTLTRLVRLCETQERRLLGNPNAFMYL